jgi:hypothetical protein
LSRLLTLAFFAAAAAAAAPISVAGQTPAPTETAVQATRAAPAQPQAKGLDPDRRVCKGTTPTGSRLAKTKICKTAREWELQKQEDRQAINRMQKLGDKQSGG